jgi:hypothetical protein
MPQSSAPTTEQRVIRGSGMSAFAVAVTFAIVGVLLGLWYPAAGMIFAFFCIAGIILFSAVGLQRHMKTIRIEGADLILTSWYAQHKIPLTAIDSLSLRTTLIGRSLAHSIVFWKGSAEEIAVVDTSPFPKWGLQVMLTMIQADHPRLQIDRELLRFLGTTW